MVIKRVSNVDRLTNAAYTYLNNILALMVIFIVLRLFEAFILTSSSSFDGNNVSQNLIGLLYDLYVVLKIAGVLIVPYFALSLLRKSIAQGFFIFSGIVLVVVSLSLQFYFATTKVLLGADLYGYNFNELTETVRASNSVSLINIIPFIIFPLLFVVLWRYIGMIKFHKVFYYVFYPIVAVVLLTSGYSVANAGDIGNYSSFVRTNKLGFFTSETLAYIQQREDMENYKASNVENSTSFLNIPIGSVDKGYPLLRVDEQSDVLSPFFGNAEKKPNIVIILVESLGRAYSGKGAELGSYTPFLDSLSEHSLYFENFLSSGGRTFAVLPSVIGSLPFGESGFASYADKMPSHNSLMSILKANGYSAQFVYGGDANFDNMSDFLKRQGVDEILDNHSKWGNCTQLPPNDRGFTWGYGDRDILMKVLKLNESTQRPTLTVSLTLAMHDPFRVPNQQYYNDKFQKRWAASKLPANIKNFVKDYGRQLSTVLFFDDALKNFFNEFSKSPDFGNTIFVITGDHRMPEIPIADQLDRFRVPLIVYSPMIVRPARFSSVSTHFDIAPSILELLKSKVGIVMPRYVHWMGAGLDTVRSFRNTRSIPLMENKNSLSCYLAGGYFLAMGNAYKVNSNLSLSENSDEKVVQELGLKLQEFKQMNMFVCSNSRIIPDSLLVFKNRK